MVISIGGYLVWRVLLAIALLRRQAGGRLRRHGQWFRLRCGVGRLSAVEAPVPLPLGLTPSCRPGSEHARPLGLMCPRQSS
jgi:hypothetical protein